MRTRTLHFLGLGWLALAAVPAVAQTTAAAWRPFRVGQTHTYQTNTTPVELETVRLAGGRVVGADSVYDFAPYYTPITAADTLGRPCSASPNSPIFIQKRNTGFGAEMRLLPAGAYQLRFTTGRTVVLQTRQLRLGSSWVFCANPAVTATVARREMRPIGSAAIVDSVAVLALSTGGEVVLSKQFGLVEAPDLLALATAPTVSRQLLTVPERALGELPDSQPLDWQPGDSVLRRYAEVSGPWTCATIWTLERYLGRQITPTGDTIFYTGTAQQIRRNSGAPNCGLPAGDVVGPVRSFRYAVAVPGPGARRGYLLRQPESTALPASPFAPADVNLGAYYHPGTNGCFAGWRYRYSSYFGRDSCQQTLLGMLDQGYHYETSPGFGIVSSSGVWSEGNLMWYRRGAQTCGSRVDFPGNLLLAAPALLPATAVAFFPNPARAAARLRLTGVKGGALTLTATDALGRRVWQTAQVVGAEAEVALPTATWAPGVYYLRVSLPEGVRVVRVVKE